MVNLILKVIVFVIVDTVIVIHYYFAITFCHTQCVLPDMSLHRQISLSPDWLLNQIVIYNIVHY